MYVVIAGGGKVGRYIAVDLIKDGHDITIIERIEKRCEALLRDHDLLVIHGDACDVRYLEQARTERADVFVATTHEDDDNFVACQLALTSFGVPRAISRVNSPRNEEIFSRMGIEAVSTTTLISRLLREELTVGELIHLSTLRGGKVNLVEVDIPHDAPVAQRTLAGMSMPEQSVIVCIFRGADETIFPHGAAKLEPGDQVIALTTPELEEDLRRTIIEERVQ